MRNLIITEGSFDTQLLEKILPESTLSNVKIVAGMGYSSAVSLAKSYYANGGAKILIVLDADTNNEEEIREKESLIDGLFSLIATDAEYKIVYFVPEIERLFFADKDFIESYFKRSFTPLELELMKQNPKVGLRNIAVESDYKSLSKNLLNSLPVSAIQKIQATPEIKKIIDFSNLEVN
jgi:hypothetical protein